MKIYITILLLFIFYQANSQYCVSSCISDGKYDIEKIEIFQGAALKFININGCGVLSAGAGSVLGRYANYKSQLIKLQKGQSYTLKVYFNTCNIFSAGPFTHISLYIDLNKNFLVDLPTELITWAGPVNVPASGSHVFNLSYTLPSSIPTDSTLFRVIAGAAWPNADYPKFCDTPGVTFYSVGETEDYTVSFCDSVYRTITKRSPLCWGDSLGRVKVVPSGVAVGSYTYSWNGGSFSAVDSLVNIPAGTYYLTTKMTGGCQYLDTIVLTQPSPLAMTKAVDSTCQQYLSGKIAVNGSGGKLPYSYSLNNGAYSLTKTWPNLGIGTYIVALRDSNLCIRRDTMKIDSFPRYSYTSFRDSTTCFKKSDGKITVVPTGMNIFKYTGYSIDGGSYQPTNQFLNLSRGWHIVRLRDTHKCISSDTVYVPSPDSFWLQVKKYDKGCLDTIGGRANIIRMGGTVGALDSFYWSQLGGGFIGQLDSLSGLALGSQTVVISHAKSCRDTVNFTINNYPFFSNISVSELLPYKCYTDTLNIVKITATGAKQPLIFGLDDTRWHSQDTFHKKHGYPLEEHSYFISIIDSLGCRWDREYKFYPQSFIYYRPTQDLTNCGTSTAKVQFSSIYWASPHAKPLQFSIHNLPYQLDSIFPAVVIPPPGQKYGWKYKDALGCIYHFDVGDSLDLKALPKPISLVDSLAMNPCIGDSLGYIRVKTSGGLVPYTYSLDGFNYSSDSVFKNLKEKIYIIRTKDANGCLDIDTVSLINIIYTKKIQLDSPIRCRGENNAIISALLSGIGVSNVQYAFQGGVFGSQNLWSNLAPTNYTISIRYNTICQLDTIISVLDPANLITNFTKTNISCFGLKNGLISATVSGGVAPYSLFINNNSNNTLTQTGLSSGYYQLKLIDKNLCADTMSYTIIEPTLFDLAISQLTQPSCANTSNGSIAIQASGGTSPYINSWSSGESNTYNKSNIAAGSYTVIATDSKGCRDSLSFTMQTSSPLVVSFKIKPILCHNESNGELTILASGGTGPYQYLWENGIQSISRSNLSASQKYTAIVSDQAGCKDTIDHQFINPDSLYLQYIATDASCYDKADGVIVSLGKGGTISNLGYYQYKFEQLPYSKTSSFFNLAPKLYLIKVRDENFCEKSVQIAISSPPQLSLIIDSIFSLDSLGQSIVLPTSLSISSSDVKYLWTPNTGLSCSDCAQPTFNGYHSQSYQITLLYNQDKCTELAQTRVLVPKANVESIFIPTTFSPNSILAENKIFRVYGKNIARIEMSIFNRWGEKVFDSYSSIPSWNGTYKQAKAQSGVYMYHLKIVFIDNQVINKSGSVSLIW